MRPIPISLRNTYPREVNFHGAVYLVKCPKTFVCKVGGSYNPYKRIMVQCGCNQNREKGYRFKYVWSIATNNWRKLELYFKRRWKPFRIEKTKTEWLLLPDDEIEFFKTASTIIYKDHHLIQEWFDLCKGRRVTMREMKRMSSVAI